jgi:2'-5' RNA ligase
MAHCVAVMLRGQAAEAVGTLWSSLRSRWGLQLSHPGAAPHLTLVVVERLPRAQQLRAGLTAVASEWAPFMVSGAGYGLFPGHGHDSAVIHVALTRTPELSALQDAAVTAVTASGGRVQGQSEPRYWRPHVTLADNELTPDRVGEVMAYLADNGPKHWTVEVDNISVVAPDGSVAWRSPFNRVA